MTLRVLSLSHQAAAAYKGKGRSQPTCRARGCRDRLGIPKPPPPGGGHAPRGAPSTRAARLLGRTHRPRLPGARCPRATLCQRPPCVRRAAHHRAKRRVGVWCSLPMLGPCAQRQRYATACCAYRPTFIRCLSINPIVCSSSCDTSDAESSRACIPLANAAILCCCTRKNSSVVALLQLVADAGSPSACQRFSNPQSSTFIASGTPAGPRATRPATCRL